MKSIKSYGLIGLLMLPLLACNKPDEKPAPPRPALVMTINESGTNVGMTLVGEVKPRYESAQGFRVAGKIIARQVEVGSHVKKGQILAKLDSADANLQVQANHADIAAAEAQLNLAKTNLERQRQLIDKKFVSAAALDSYEAQYKSAAARLQQTQAQTASANNQSRYTTLGADRDGIVTQINAEPGQVVSAGEVIAHIIDPTALEVHIAVPESRMSNLNLNDDVVVRLWAKREKAYSAHVREIAPMADPVTRTFLVKLSLINPDAEVRLGMTAGARFSKEMHDVILLPSPALVQIQQKPAVWLVNAQQQVKPHAVTIGSYREDGVLITQGLQMGDRVVVAGANALVDGQIVRPVEATGLK